MKPSTRAWTVTILTLIFMLINFADKAVLGLVAVPMMDELGLDAAQFGFIASSFYFLFNISAIVYGFIATRQSPKMSLLILAGVWTVAQLPLFFSVPFIVIVLTRILLGIGEGPAYPLANHAVFQWFPARRRALPSSLLTVGVGLGGVISAPLLGIIIAGFDWHAAFLAMAIASAVWGVAWLILGKDTDQPVPAATVAVGTKAQKSAVDETHVPYKKLFTTKTFIGGVLGGFASYWGLATMIAWLPAYLEQVGGLDSKESGLMLMLPWSAQALLTIGIGGFVNHLAKRGFSGRKAVGFGGGTFLSLGGVLVVLFAFIGYNLSGLVMMTVGFGMVSFIYALQQTSVANMTPSKQRAATLSTSNALLTLGGVAAPFVGGLLLDASPTLLEGYRNVFILAGVIMIIGAAIFAIFVQPEKDAKRFGLTPTSETVANHTSTESLASVASKKPLV